MHQQEYRFCQSRQSISPLPPLWRLVLKLQSIQFALEPHAEHDEHAMHDDALRIVGSQTLHHSVYILKATGFCSVCPHPHRDKEGFNE